MEGSRKGNNRKTEGGIKYDTGRKTTIIKGSQCKVALWNLCKSSKPSFRFWTNGILYCAGREQVYGAEIEDIQLYLRPMSSMTEEEEILFRCELPTKAKTDAQLVAMRMELFLKGHLDYNHLIEKGLALEAPESMYKEK